MELRKVYTQSKALAVNLPKSLYKVLGLEPGNYVELFLADKDTLVIRKHNLEQRRKA